MPLHPKRKTLLGFVQWFVVATSFFPLKQFYIAVYRLIVWWLARRLYKEPGVLAVYVKGGIAKGETVPGISDIDLAAVVDFDDLPARYNWQQLKIRTQNDWYYRLTEQSALFEEAISVFQLSYLAESIRLRYRIQYRVAEAKATWKLLRGADYFSTLPDLSSAELRGGIYNEMVWWWRHFARHIINNKENWTDPLTRNGLCYRITCGVLKAALSLQTGELHFHREGALEKAKTLLDREEQAFVDRLLAVKKRYLTDDRSLVNANKDFLLNYMDRFFGQLLEHPFGHALKQTSLRVDCPLEECWHGAQTDAQQTVAYARQRWGERFRAAYLGPSVFFEVDDLLLLVEVDLQNLPSLEQLNDLSGYHQGLQEVAHRRLHLFILLPHAAFHFGRFIFSGMTGWNNLITQACIPDIFELVGQREFALSGGGYRPLKGAAWSSLVQFFARSQRVRYFDKMAFTPHSEWTSREFLKTFWKCAQLIILNRSAASDEILYALTPPAIERGLGALGVPLPEDLRPLAQAYPAVLEGAQVELQACLSPALAYLNAIEPNLMEITQQ